MKQKFFHAIMVCIWLAAILAGLAATAQTSDNFNSRPGIITSQVKGHLQGKCWSFPDFDVNRNGWVPAIEGDGAFVSGTSSSSTQNTGIYTPVLDVAGSLLVSFKYKFNNTPGNGIRRWIKIYLTTADDTIEDLLDSVELSGVNHNTVYKYNKFFNAGSGLYKVYINYQGIGGSTRIALDDLAINASLRYPGGCNDAPIAVNDVITGKPNRTATAFICSNDSDPNHESFTPYVVTNSPHGNVTINPDGSFTFSPTQGFSGNSTSFVYKVCDDGYGPLCSDDATVTINFPSGSMLPVSLGDLHALYKNDGRVEVSWFTNFEQNTDRFIIERSMDGTEWIEAGVLPGQGTSTIRHSYKFVDKLSRFITNKNDLYYRLKQMDLDGSAKVSRILIVRVYNTRALKMVSVTPNPSKNDIAVTMQTNEPIFVTMKILNGNGIQMMRKSLKAQEGENTFVLDGSGKLMPGIYILEVIVNSNERMIVKLIKE